eukprot:c4881_g1_i1 orf=132-365(+)
MARSGSGALKMRNCRRASLQGGKESKLRELCDTKGELAKLEIEKNGAGDTNWIDSIHSCPVFYPTKEEFEDPLQYLQ